jgi:hypothetical protein
VRLLCRGKQSGFFTARNGRLLPDVRQGEFGEPGHEAAIFPLKTEDLVSGVIEERIGGNSLVPTLPASHRHINLNCYIGPLEQLPYLR